MGSWKRWVYLGLWVQCLTAWALTPPQIEFLRLHWAPGDVLKIECGLSTPARHFWLDDLDGVATLATLSVLLHQDLVLKYWQSANYAEWESTDQHLPVAHWMEIESLFRTALGKALLAYAESTDPQPHTELRRIYETLFVHPRTGAVTYGEIAPIGAWLEKNAPVHVYSLYSHNFTGPTPAVPVFDRTQEHPFGQALRDLDFTVPPFAVLEKVRIQVEWSQLIIRGSTQVDCGDAVANP